MVERPVVVIVGAGFGGMNAARALRQAPVDVVIIDRNNYHLFQPLLYQVATSAVSEDEVAYPVRAIFRDQENERFVLSEVTNIDLEARQVVTTTNVFKYDFLILAPGGETNYFGIDSVREHGFGLKDLEDATSLRNHILKMFELSTQIEDPLVRQSMRNFVVVGGGPTGVEFAGALSELIRLVLVKDYPEIDFSEVAVILLEMMDRVLIGFPEQLSEKAVETLRSKHVQVEFGATVAGYDGAKVTLTDGREIPTYTLVWAAGVRAVSFLNRLGVEQARQGRVGVDQTLQIPGHPEVFVIGDAAYLEEGGDALPMMAPVAIQQAKLAARNVQNLIAGAPLEEFDYRDPGMLATIGRNAAVARVKAIDFHGFLAWLVWLMVHLYWLIGFRNRLIVMINWALDYIFYERSVRLITPEVRAARTSQPEEILERI